MNHSNDSRRSFSFAVYADTTKVDNVSRKESSLACTFSSKGLGAVETTDAEAVSSAWLASMAAEVMASPTSNAWPFWTTPVFHKSLMPEGIVVHGKKGH